MKKIPDVNIDLKTGGTLNLMDGDAIKKWIVTHTNKTLELMYDCVHHILDKHFTKSKVKGMYEKHINKQSKNRVDTIKAFVAKFSKVCVKNN